MGLLAYLKLLIDLRFNMHTELAQWLCTTNDMHNVCYVVAGSEAGEQPIDRIRAYRIQLLVHRFFSFSVFLPLPHQATKPR